jgi:ComF family protein
MSWFDPLQRLLPCQLCGQQPGQLHSLCPQCWQELPWLSGRIKRQQLDCQVCCRYQWPMDQMLQRFKDQSALHYLPIFLGCLASTPKPPVQAIVPMPINHEKLISRGFNQSLLLAKALAQHWRLPIWQPVARIEGHSQRGLDRLDRLQNLRQQFFLQATTAPYSKVLMLDDVITTGSSLLALQQQLHSLGCQQIYALCLCDAQR